MTRRRATNQMANDDEMMRVAKDTAKHSYAQGTVNLRAVFERLVEMAFDGQPVKDSDVNWFHDQLSETNTLLRRSVVSLAGPPGFDEQEDAVDAFISSYDDTTPVFLLKTSEEPQSRAAQAAPKMFEGDVLWRPDVRWADDRFSATEMRPGGWTVAVVDPPHLRKPSARDEAVPRAVSPVPSEPPPWLNDAPACGPEVSKTDWDSLKAKSMVHLAEAEPRPAQARTPRRRRKA